MATAWRPNDRVPRRSGGARLLVACRAHCAVDWRVSSCSCIGTVIHFARPRTAPSDISTAQGGADRAQRIQQGNVALLRGTEGRLVEVVAAELGAPDVWQAVVCPRSASCGLVRTEWPRAPRGMRPTTSPPRAHAAPRRVPPLPRRTLSQLPCAPHPYMPAAPPSLLGQAFATLEALMRLDGAHWRAVGTLRALPHSLLGALARLDRDLVTVVANPGPCSPPQEPSTFHSFTQHPLSTRAQDRCTDP